MGFHPAPTAEEAAIPKAERKLARVQAGTAHAALVFEGDACVGWAQFGHSDEVPRIKSLAEYCKGLAGLPDWRIACCSSARATAARACPPRPLQERSS